MPWTTACGFRYASTLKRHGTEIPVVVRAATSTQPTRYSGAQAVLCQSPSIEASLRGWMFVTSIACSGPNAKNVPHAKKMNPVRAIFMFAIASSRWRF